MPRRSAHGRHFLLPFPPAKAKPTACRSPRAGSKELKLAAARCQLFEGQQLRLGTGANAETVKAHTYTYNAKIGSPIGYPIVSTPSRQPVDVLLTTHIACLRGEGLTDSMLFLL